MLRPYENGLILHTMYYADEVRDFDAIDIEDAASAARRKSKLAEMLINELTEKKFNPLQFKDEYRERLLDRIRAKSKGKTDRQPRRRKRRKAAKSSTSWKRCAAVSGRTAPCNAPRRASRSLAHETLDAREAEQKRRTAQREEQPRRQRGVIERLLA